MKNITELFENYSTKSKYINESMEYFPDATDFESEYNDYVLNRKHSKVLYKLFDFLLETDALVSTIPNYRASDDIEYDFIDPDKMSFVIFLDDDSAVLIEFPNRLNSTKLNFLISLRKELEKINKIVDSQIYR